jgi:branched-chain amino acid transport system ATP-binding protein
VVEQLVAALRGVMADSSLAVLLVEQRVDVVLEMSSRCLIMDRGRVVHEEASALLRQNSDLLAQLIGLE